MKVNYTGSIIDVCPPSSPKPETNFHQVWLRRPYSVPGAAVEEIGYPIADNKDRKMKMVSKVMQARCI